MRYARTIALSAVLVAVGSVGVLGRLRAPLPDASAPALTTEIIQRFPALGRTAAAGQGFHADSGQQWRGQGSELGSELPGRYTEATVISHGGVTVRSRPLDGNAVPATPEGTALTYRGAYPSTDVLYTSTATGTEEFLLLRDRAAPTRFSYELSYAPGVMARLADGSVVLADARGDTIRIAAPTAVDADGKRVDAVRWQLQQGAAGSRLDLVIDAGTAPYPLLIDPSWVAVSALPAAEGYGALNYLASISAPILTGGFTGSLLLDTCQIYNTSTHAWTTSGATMHTPHATHTATVLGSGLLLVVGGYNAASGNPTPTGVCETFDGTAWTLTGSLTTPRGQHGAVLLGSGKVLIMGGDDGGSTTYASAELYDPSGGTFSSAGSMSSVREFFGSVLLPSGNVLVAGGILSQHNNGNQAPLSACEIYDPVHNSWSATGSMASGRTNFSLVLLPNSTVMAIGGAGSTGNSSSSDFSSCEIYDPTAGTWSAGPALNVARSSYALVQLDATHILVAGGSDGAQNNNNGNPMASSEVLTTTAGTWGVVPNLSYATISPVSCLLPSGHALVAGGGLAANNTFTAVTAEYDPTATEPTPTLSVPPVTVAENGQVTITLNGVDADSILNYVITAQPAHGSLSTVVGNQIVYQPNAGYTGADSFTVVANDGVLSSTAATAAITVQPLPTLTLIGSPTVAVGGTVFLSNVHNLTASEGVLPASELTYTIVNAPLYGTIKNGATPLTAGGTFTQADLVNGVISYVQDGTFTTLDAVSLDVTDNLGSTTPIQQGLILVTGTAAAPTGSLTLTVGGPDAVTPNVKYVLTGNVAGGDLNGAETGGYLPADLTYTITSAPVNGKFLLVLGANNNPQLGVNPPLGVGSTFSQLDVNNGKIAYKLVPSAGVIAPSDSVTVTLTDGTTTTAAMTLNFTTVSATYVLNNMGMVASFNNSTPFTSAMLYSAASPSLSASSIIYTLVSTPANGGQLQDNGTTLSSGQTFTQADIGNGNLQYSPNNNNGNTDSFTFTVNGSSTNTFNITLQAGPQLSGSGVATVQAGGTVAITPAILDATSGLVPAVEMVYTLNNTPNAGELLLGATVLSNGSTFTQQDINNGQISYFQNNSMSNAVEENLNFSLAAGGLASSNNNPNLIIIINHPPVLVTNRTLTVNHDGSVIITSNDLLATSMQHPPSALTYALQTLPANGTVDLAGVPLGLSGTFTQANINAGAVTFVQGPGVAGGDSFSFIVSDGAGGAAPLASMTITVASGPLITANAGILVQHTIAGTGTATILPTNLQASEFGIAASSLTFSLVNLPSKGHLKLSGTVLTGVSTFTQANINASLLTYIQDVGDGESDSFTITVSDGTNTIPATIVPIAINHPPVLAVNATMYIPSGGGFNQQSFNTSLLMATDIEQADAQLVFTLLSLPTQGTIVTFTGATLGVGATFTQEQIDNSQINYQASGNPTGTDSFTFTVSDGAGGITPTETFHISFPTGLQVSADTGLQFTANTSPPSTMNIFNNNLNAVDGSNNPVLTWTVTNSPIGSIQVQSAGTWSNASTFTSNDLQSGNVRYSTTATSAGTDSVTLSVTDGTNTVMGVVFPITLYSQTTIGTTPGYTVDLGTQAIFHSSNPINVNDPNVTAGMADQQVFTLATPPTNGTLLLNGFSLAAGQTFTQDDLNNGHVVYAAPASGSSDSFFFTYSDGVVPMFGPGPSGTVNFTLNALPFPITNTPISIASGTPTPITTGNLSYGDNDGALTLTFNVTSGSSGLTVLGAPATSFTEAQLSAGQVSYTASSSTSMTFTVNDGIGGQTAPATLTINVSLLSQTISFTPIATPQTYPVAVPIALSATGGASGLPVIFSVISGPGSITGGVSPLTITGAGTVVIAANQAGNGTYAAAPQVTQTITVNQGTQTITFALPATEPFSNTPISLAPPASASSGLPILFTVTAGAATITGGGSQLSLTPGVALGAVTVEAQQIGNANYLAAAPVSQTFTVTQGSQTISFPQPLSQPVGASPLTLAPLGSSSSGLPITWSVVAGGSATASITGGGTQLTWTTQGTIILEADQAGNLDFTAAAPVQETISVVASPQTITFTPLVTTQTYGVAPLALSASGGASGNPVVFSVVSGPGTITGGVSPLTITGAGTVVVAANQAGDSTYAAAPTITQTITVNPAGLTVTATALQPKVYGAAMPTLTYAITGFVNGDTVAVVGGVPALTPTATAASPVGTYPTSVAIGSLTATNYTFAFASGSVQVTPATLTVTATNLQPKVYGAAMPTLTYAITGFVNGDTVAVVGGVPALTPTATAASGVGTYPTSVAIGTLTATNYTFAFASGSVQVTPATLTVTATTLQPKVYGAAMPTLTYAITGFVNGDTVAVVGGAPALTPTATAASPVGTYPTSVAMGSLLAVNYTFAFASGSVQVTPAALTVTATSLQPKVYGAAMPTLTYAITGFVNGDTVAVVGGAPALTPTATAASPVGTYPTSVAIGTLTATNYTFAFASGSVQVTPATLTVTATNLQPKVYGAAMPTLTYAITGFVNGDTVAVVGGVPALTPTATAASGVGTYPTSVAIGTLTATNYTFAFASGSVQVTPATLTVTATNLQPKVYGAAMPTLTYAITGFVNGDTVAVVGGAPALTPTATAASPVGTYPTSVAIGSLTAANYSFAFASGSVQVTPATLTVTATNLQPKVYGAAMPTLTYAITGFVNGDTVAVVGGAPALTPTMTAASPVGTYPTSVAIGSLTATNYTFAFASGSVQVTPATLTVTATNLQPKVYGAAMPTLTYAITGFVNGDTVAVVGGVPALTPTATAASGVGTYPTSVAIGTLTATNYTFAFASGSVQVTPATLTVTATTLQPKVYGAAMPTLTYAITGFVNGDTVAVVGGAPALTPTATAASPVGTYPTSVAMGSLLAVNYSFAFASGSVQVTPATLTVTATNLQPKVYGAAMPTLTYAITGFVNGDTVAVVGGAPALTPTVTAASPVGTYPTSVAIGSLTATNYTFAFASGSVQVTPAILTVTASDQAMVQGSVVPTLTYSITGFVNGDTVASATIGTPMLTNLVTSGSGVGVYLTTTAIGSLTAADYTFTLVNGSVTVANNILTVTANAQTKVYGAAAPALTYTITGFVGGDTQITATSGQPALVNAVSAGSAVGTYTTTTAIGTLTSVTPNKYAFTLVNGSVAVTPAPLTITADDLSKVAGAANPALTVTYAGLVNGDTQASLTTPPTITTTATTGSGAGAYPIIPSGAVDANYTIIYVNGTLTVTGSGSGPGSPPQGTAGGGCGLGNGVVGLVGLLLLALRLVQLQILGGRRQRPR